MAGGLKQHTHQERARVVKALVPLVQRHMGRDLIALAVTGSFARNTDGAYSDIELIGFVKRQQHDREVVNLIHDGMLIHLWFLTRQDYLYHHKQRVGAEWSYAAMNTLVPLINEPFVRELIEVPWALSREDRFRALREFWPLVQEAAGKLLTAASREDSGPVPFLYWQMVEKICVALSLLNGRPYTTRAAIFDEARTFKILPKSFDRLIAPAEGMQKPSELAGRALAAFGEVEELLYAHGAQPNAESLDAFVSPLSAGRRLRRRMQIGRKIRRTANFGRAIGSWLSFIHRKVLGSAKPSGAAVLVKMAPDETVKAGRHQLGPNP